LTTIQSSPSQGQSSPSQGLGLQPSPSQGQSSPSQGIGLQPSPSQGQSSPSQGLGLQSSPSQGLGLQSSPSQGLGLQPSPVQGQPSPAQIVISSFLWVTAITTPIITPKKTIPIIENNIIFLLLVEKNPVFTLISSLVLFNRSFWVIGVPVSFLS